MNLKKTVISVFEKLSYSLPDGDQRLTRDWKTTATTCVPVVKVVL